MKKYIAIHIIFFTILALLSTSCENKKKGKVESEAAIEIEHSWSEANKAALQKNCIGFLVSDAVEHPGKYCDCLLETVIKNYPMPEDAIALSQHELAKLFENSECIDDILLIKIESPWDEEVEKIFLDECLTSAKKKYSTEVEAKTYCDCALVEIKKIIPNPQHVIALTENELNLILEKCK